MTKKIKKDSYTIDNFKSLLKQVSSPFKHCSSDGYITMINPHEAVCINEMALNTIDGVLQQKRQAEEIARLNALEKARKAKKRKRTPNTMRGDDGIGITMGLQHHDQETNVENLVALVVRLQKDIEKLEKTLQSYAKIEQKHKGRIEFERCTGKELNILMSFVFPKSGMLSKPVEVRKQKFREKGINSDNIKYLANKEHKKLTKLKLEISNIEKQPGEYDDEDDDNDDNDDYLCAEI